MSDRLLELIVVNSPNFLGLVLLVYMQWRIIKILLEKVNGNNHDDDDD